MDKRIALVTGANRGIGLEICRQLATRGLHVLMTARDSEKARQASRNFAGALEVLPLDVVSGDSRQSLADRLMGSYERLDVLINNAGVFIDRDHGGTTVPMEIVRTTLETNLIGAWHLTQILLPLLEKGRGSRVINISSGLGAISEMSGGYPAYRVSKTALNALTLILASELESTGIAVNTVCPGWVKTDMGGPGAPREVEAGADTAVWLATAEHIPTGKFFRDRQVIPW